MSSALITAHLTDRVRAIGDPHHPEGAPVGELTGIRHILPQDGRQFFARDFASLRRCAMRSRIATHSQEVRRLQRLRIEVDCSRPATVCWRPGGDPLAAAAALVGMLSRTRNPISTNSRKIFESLFVNQSSPASNRGGRLWPSTLWGTR